MKIKNLLSKLKKMKIEFYIDSYSNSYEDYNKDIVFTINGLTFKASYREGELEIDYYSQDFKYDNCNQQMECFFYYSFKHVLSTANKF
jgi:hypothetical protein